MSIIKKYFKKSPKVQNYNLNTIVQNPVINSRSSNHQIIKEYLQLHGLSFDNLLNWSCPICLENFDSCDMSMCIPFMCSHPICFSCLKGWCTNLKKRHSFKELNSISCCLCRKQSNDFWYNSFKVYTLTTCYQNTIMTLVFPSKLDHRYPLREE